MIGAFIASTGDGAPCHECGSRIRRGAEVFYDGPRLDDDVRTCSECVPRDLFGRVA